MERSTVILLDTHIWMWWVHSDPSLSSDAAQVLADHEATSLCVSVISCWEVAKLVERGRINLPLPIDQWIPQALAYPGIRLLELTPEIAVESTRLPQPFHKDPADQLIVATARIHQMPLITSDTKIRAYPHVQLLPW